MGITLDVTRSLAMLPEDKLSRCRELLREAIARKTMTLRELQSLLGHLNFACRVVVPGRAFLRRVYALTQKVKKHYHHVKITKEVRADLGTWCDNRPPSGWLRGAKPLGPFLGPLTSFPSV